MRACVLQGGRFVSDGVLTSAEQIFYLLPNEIEEVISARANIAKLDPIVQFEERGAAVSELSPLLPSDNRIVCVSATILRYCYY